MKELKNMGWAAMATVALAIVTLIGIAIVTGIGDNQRVNTEYTENITLDLSVAVELSNTLLLESAGMTLTNSSSDVIDSSNYTVDWTAGTVTLTDGDNDAEEVTAEYTYRAASSTTTVAALFSAGLLVFGTFISLISLVLVGKIIIGLVRK